MVVYAKFNLARKPRFQLATSVHRNSGGLVTVKQARNTHSSAFLQRMVTFADAHQTLSPGLRLAHIESHTDSEIIFEHVAGQSLHTRALLALRARKHADFVETLRAYAKIVDSLSVETDALDERFPLVFGDALHGEHALLTQGLFDLNFDNLIESDNGTVVIDYEWTFDFPVPKAYVLYRALAYLYTAVHEYAPHEALPFAEACEMLGIPVESAEAFQKTEHAFQQYVLGQHHVPRLKAYINDANRMLAGTDDPESAAHGYEQLKRQFEQRVGEVKQLNTQLKQAQASADTVEHENARLKKRIHTLDRDIHTMEQSHFWKLRNRYIKIKDTLRRR